MNDDHKKSFNGIISFAHYPNALKYILKQLDGGLKQLQSHAELNPSVDPTDIFQWDVRYGVRPVLNQASFMFNTTKEAEQFFTEAYQLAEEKLYGEIE